MGTATISLFGVRDAPFAYNVLRVRIAEEETDVILGGQPLPLLCKSYVLCFVCVIFSSPLIWASVHPRCMYAFRRTMDSVCSPFWWFPSVLHANSRVPDRHTACPSSLSCPLSQTLDVAIKRHRRRIPLLLHLRGTMQSSISFFCLSREIASRTKSVAKITAPSPGTTGLSPKLYIAANEPNPSAGGCGRDLKPVGFL